MSARPLEHEFCSLLARSADEPMLGTAHRVAGFILIEWPRKLWGRQQFQSRGLPPELVVQLREIQRTHRYFTRLISDGTARESIQLRLMPNNRVLHLPSIDAVTSTLAKIFPGGNEIDHGALQRWPEEEASLILICTNGARDRCCAKFGFAAFRQAVRVATNSKLPLKIYQSTHLTGDRFAATALVLPTGDLYGWLNADNIAAFIATISGGDIDLGHYRGSSFLDEIEQIAWAAVAERSQVEGRRLIPEEWNFERQEGTNELVVVASRLVGGIVILTGYISLTKRCFPTILDCSDLDLRKGEMIERWTMLAVVWE